MRMKQNVLDITDKMDTLLEVSAGGLKKHTITPEQLYKNIIQLKTDLERAVALIKREPAD